MVAQPRTATARRSSRQQQQQEQQQQASANNNNIVAAASKDEEDEANEEEESEDDDDEPSGDACSECGIANQRVMVTCAACAQHFHLGCATPALRRRPVLVSSWQCAKCTQSAGKSTSARAQRSAKNTSEAIGDGDDVKKTKAAMKSEPVAVAAADSGANGRTVRKRGVAAASARASAPVAAKTETNVSDGDAEPPKKSRRTAAAAAVKVESSGSAAAGVAAAKEAAIKVAASVKSAAAVAKSKGKQPKSAAASIKVSAKPKRAAQSKFNGNNNSKKAPARASKTAKKKAFTTDSEDDDDADSGGGDDDDGDSDFKSDDASDFKSDDDDDDDVSVASDDEFVLSKKKLPTLKTPPKKKANSKSSAKGKSPAKKSPAKGRKRAASQPTNGDASAENGNGASNGIGNDGDADSMDLSNQGEEEEEEEVEEAYAGPRYYIEYAANNRAKCKQCEEKLMKDSLRIGVRVKHSIFGLTTYYKHLSCTQICLSTAAKEAQENAEAAESLGTVSSPAKAESQPEPEVAGVKEENASDNKPIDPIQGFSSLTKADQAIVCAHMTKIEDEGLLDERLAITEDHYNKKTRMPEKEPSPFLTVPLLPYQCEALAWMTAQEKSEYKGGILADEMGMGKTIQAIAVILENVRQKDDGVSGAATAGNGKGKSKASAKNKVNSPIFLRGGTLVVCPVVAVMQWKSEIERFVERNHLSIYIHHGPKRCTIPEKIASYDIVLTTYSIIENEVRKTLGWDKVPCKYCKKKYLPDKLILHNKYFCGPNAKKTVLQDKQRSNKPKRKKAAGEEDSDEDDEAFYPKKPAPKAKPRGKKVEIIDESDDDDDEPVLFKKSTSKSPLHQINWTRIVLDEAHYIKDRRNNTARGVFELKSEYKWCLTGTPLQNRIGELFSLIRFLQIKSYAYYHCNNCECQLLDFHFPNGKCELCEHTAMQHYSFFNKKIVIPIQAYGYVAEGKIAMLRLQNEVLQHILLRRTKEGRADDICLPPKLVRIRKDHLDERENDFYEAIYTQSQAQFNTYVSSGTLLNNYAHIFDLLIRLRQAVDHPYLVIFSKSNPALQLPASSTSGINIRPVVEEKPLLSTQADGENDDGYQERACTICHEDMEDPVVAKCGDGFCRECVKEFIESLPVGAEATCPTCSKLLTVDLEPKVPEVGDDENREGGANEDSPKTATKKPQRAAVDLSRYHKTSILHRISDVHAFQTSTKIEALMQELELMRQRDPSGKAIIFSQFVNMLDIIQHRLQLGGVKCVKMSGNMSMDMRDRTIKAFREDSSVTAFLISLKAGGVALNLTIASHIFLMDPWWNPAAENQAIDRTHRLGQFKPIQATRFIIAGTVEERILKLQEKKRLIFEGTVGASVSAVCRLTTEDLRFLFSR